MTTHEMAQLADNGYIMEQVSYEDANVDEAVSKRQRCNDKTP